MSERPLSPDEMKAMGVEGGQEEKEADAEMKQEVEKMDQEIKGGDEIVEAAEEEFGDTESAVRELAKDPQRARSFTQKLIGKGKAAAGIASFAVLTLLAARAAKGENASEEAARASLNDFGKRGNLLEQKMGHPQAAIGREAFDGLDKDETGLPEKKAEVQKKIANALKEKGLDPKSIVKTTGMDLASANELYEYAGSLLGYETLAGSTGSIEPSLEKMEEAMAWAQRLYEGYKKHAQEQGWDLSDPDTAKALALVLRKRLAEHAAVIYSPETDENPEEDDVESGDGEPKGETWEEGGKWHAKAEGIPSKLMDLAKKSAAKKAVDLLEQALKEAGKLKPGGVYQHRTPNATYTEEGGVYTFNVTVVER